MRGSDGGSAGSVSGSHHTDSSWDVVSHAGSSEAEAVGVVASETAGGEGEKGGKGGEGEKSAARDTAAGTAAGTAGVIRGGGVVGAVDGGEKAGVAAASVADGWDEDSDGDGGSGGGAGAGVEAVLDVGGGGKPGDDDWDDWA